MKKRARLPRAAAAGGVAPVPGLSLAARGSGSSAIALVLMPAATAVSLVAARVNTPLVTTAVAAVVRSMPPILIVCLSARRALVQGLMGVGGK